MASSAKEYIGLKSLDRRSLTNERMRADVNAGP